MWILQLPFNTKSGDDFSEVGGNWGDGDVDPWKK